MTPASSRLRKIVLHLARQKGFPEGSARHGYDFVAPLDEAGKIDAAAWREVRAACIVHRFWADEPVMRGLLVHKPGGRAGATWAFDYDRGSDDDDEAGFRFGDHAFNTGEYVSVRDEDGELHAFRVVSVGGV